ncbi:MAG: hypothetical protein NUV60_02090 [Patescibacteria group bacterium]|nr:hypothetical protein [Patescibacteria group bacterium]
MTRFLITVTLVLLVGYGLVEAWPLWAGPSLSIVSPAEDASFSGGIVDIRGKATRTALLMLNGAPILRDQNGDFSSTMTFSRGGSILTLVATDRFGRSVSATRSIFVP